MLVMSNDIRYSELQFLQSLPKGTSSVFNHQDPKKGEAVGLNPTMFIEMVITMIEELYVRLEDEKAQRLVGKLRGEASGEVPSSMIKYDWDNPREALAHLFMENKLQSFRLTYRGLRRIDELRERLARDRILEPFGVLLSMQYFRSDLQNALRLNNDISVSVLYADMDHFKRVNTDFGQSAGDVVMKAYLEVIRDRVGMFGKGYRGVGDEVAVLIRGQGHDKAKEFADQIRKSVEDLRCVYEGNKLPPVTASIGVATTPPGDRKMELETLAEDRKRQAKQGGRNRVVAE
jgi:diguanylate cyclase (GGDEF)-like protein